jgi:hypothetical protein
MMAPNGRKRKLMPIRAKARICASPGFDASKGARNSGASKVPVSWAKIKKSYHSMVVPTRVPARTLRSSLGVLGPASESTKEGVVIENSIVYAGLLRDETLS